MIIGKIKAKDFPLFDEEDILKQNGLHPEDIIEIVYGRNGVPDDIDTLEQVKNYYCADFYYPKQKISSENLNNNFGFGEMFDYDTFPINISDLISLENK